MNDNENIKAFEGLTSEQNGKADTQVQRQLR